MIAKHFSASHVWHLREYGIDDYELYYCVPDWYVRLRYAKSDAVIAISQSMYNSFVNERRLWPAAKTRVIYNGLTVPEAYAKRQPDSRIHFCIVGAIFSGKNQESVIMACGKLKALTDNFTLHIIGGDGGEYASKLKELSCSLGISENVTFWGFRYDVNDILRNMDVGIVPSKREAFGRVTVEYMLHYSPS